MSLDTTDMPYPPQMVESIKMLMHVREEAIVHELENFGVTGIKEGGRR
jgi:hypothetical protein